MIGRLGYEPGAMLGPLLLLAAAISPDGGSAPSRASAFRPTSAVTAQATASVRIVSGVRFGRAHSQDVPPEAIRRPASVTDGSGRTIPAELLEFQ
jgi:hypothetical protein